jgi:hypothetical protein
LEEVNKNDENIQEIDLTNSFSGETIDLTKLLKESNLIFLETTDSCLIGEVKKVVAVDSLLFILDSLVSNKLFLFNSNGKFIRQIGVKGQGPGEYIQATDCHYDKDKKEIIIFDQFKSEFLFYDLNGNYLRNKKFPFRFIQFAKAGEKYLYKHLLDNDRGIADYSLSIGSDSTQIEQIALPICKFNYAGGKLQTVNDSVASYGIPFCDTIYHYESGILSAKYHLKFNPSTHLPENFGKKTDYDYMKFRKRYPSSKYTYFLGDFVETDRYLFFPIQTKFVYYFFYNKIEKQLLSGMNLLNSDDRFEKMLLFHKPISNCGDFFIAPIEAHTIFSLLSSPKNENYRDTLYAKYPQLVNMKEDDNPFLFFYSLK